MCACVLRPPRTTVSARVCRPVFAPGHISRAYRKDYKQLRPIDLMNAEVERCTSYRSNTLSRERKEGDYPYGQPAEPPERPRHGRVRPDPGPGFDRRHRDSFDHGQPDQQRFLERGGRAGGLTLTAPWWGRRAGPTGCLP